MNYKEALEKAAKEISCWGFKTESASEFIDYQVHFELDYRDYMKKKGVEYKISGMLQYLCDLYEGKTCEDRSTIIYIPSGSVERLKKFGVIQ